MTTPTPAWTQHSDYYGYASTITGPAQIVPAVTPGHDVEVLVQDSHGWASGYHAVLTQAYSDTSDPGDPVAPYIIPPGMTLPIEFQDFGPFGADGSNVYDSTTYTPWNLADIMAQTVKPYAPGGASWDGGGGGGWKWPYSALLTGPLTIHAPSALDTGHEIELQVFVFDANGQRVAAYDRFDAVFLQTPVGQQAISYGEDASDVVIPAGQSAYFTLWDWGPYSAQGYITNPGGQGPVDLVEVIRSMGLDPIAAGVPSQVFEPPPVQVTGQPYYVRQRQDWAIANERQKHQQALYSIGEPAIFTLMWKVEDFDAGLVGKCSRCSPSPTSIEGRIAAAYEQPLSANCPVCYGTTFQGGIRAQIIAPAIFTDSDEDERVGGRGVVHPERTTVETTADFRTRTGDYVFRRDGSRWQLGAPARVQVRTGYEQPTQQSTSIGYARIDASREDAASVAFVIPPDRDSVRGLLTVSGTSPSTASPIVLVDGPLIPPTAVE